MKGYIFVAQGDLTQLSADAITYSASTYLDPSGDLYSAFKAQVPGFAEQFRDLARPCGLGDTFWLPLPDGGRPHGVVVVASTGGKASRDEKARRAVTASLARAIGELRGRGHRERLLIALPAFRAGQGGDRPHLLTSARTQIQAAGEVLDRPDARDVDVAFITYTPGVYQIFLEARRQVLGKGGAAGSVQFPAELVHELRQGECVLFVGAGLSSEAGLPDWGELIRQLSTDLGLTPPADMDLDYHLDLAQWYAERFGPERLTCVLRETFGSAGCQGKPTLSHYLAMSLPVRYIITTNYDDLLERALLGLRRYPIKVVRQEEVVRTGQSDGVYLVKFHGDADHGANLILSRDDFDAFFAQRPAMAALLEGLLLNQTFFFLGYGLRDPNFRQIYTRIATMLKDAKRGAYAATFDPATAPHDYVAEQWRKKGLRLIRVPGTRPEQPQCFLRGLDQLADEVTTHAPHLFLAEDVEVSPGLRRLRDHLIGGVGAEVERLCQGELSEDDARHLATVLGYLTNTGWRPRAQTPYVGHLWQRLADATRDPSERWQLLLTAFRHTETLGAARKVHEQLEALEKELSPEDSGPPAAPP